MTNGTQAVDRAVQLIKLFDDEQPYWDLTQLVDASGLNKTTVHRLLGALESEGLIERHDDNRYKLGSELIALGGRAARANNLRTVSHPHLQALTEQTGETTTLEILRPDRDGQLTMLVIDEVLGRHLVGITQYIGSRLPVHATSTGKAVMAFQAPQVIERVMAQAAETFTPTTLGTEAYQRELEATRERGYATALGELETGLIAIGAPVFDHNSHVQAAISVIGPSVRIDDTRLAELIPLALETANSISHQIGYRKRSANNQ